MPAILILKIIRNALMNLQYMFLCHIHGLHTIRLVNIQPLYTEIYVHTLEVNHHGNPSLPAQNGCHFTDDIFKHMFLNENMWISIKISLKFVPTSPIDNNPALVQIKAWHQLGDKPLSEPMLIWFTDAYMRHHGGDELKRSSTIHHGCRNIIILIKLHPWLQQKMSNDNFQCSHCLKILLKWQHFHFCAYNWTNGIDVVTLWVFCHARRC